MTRSELIAELAAANPHLTGRDVEHEVVPFLQHTGEAVPVDEKVVPFFKAGKELRERVNRGKPARGGTQAERVPA